MKRSIKKILVIMLAVMMMSASVTMAAQSRPDIRSLPEKLADLIPDDIDLSGVLDCLKDKLAGVADSLGGLKDKLSDAAGDFLDLLGSLSDSGDEEAFGTETADAEDDADIDDEELFGYYEMHYNAINEAIDRHMRELFAEYLEPGDASICSTNVAQAQELEEDTVLLLGDFVLTNFDADGTDLVLKNSARNTELLTVAQNESEGYDVIDFRVAEDGSGYADSVASMCEEIGISTDTFYSSMAFNDLTYLVDLHLYLEEHPEYERIEYQGSLMTLEDLDAAMDDIFTQIADMVETEG